MNGNGWLTCAMAVILAVLCLLQERIRRNMAKRFPEILYQDSTRFRAAWLLYTFFLLCALFLDIPMPVICLGVMLTEIVPGLKTTYTSLCIRSGEAIILMAFLLVADSVLKICGIDMGKTEYAPVHRALLCAAEAFVVIFLTLFQKKYHFRREQENYDKKRMKIFAVFILFCVLYVFEDGLLSLLGEDGLFVPVMVIAGNLLILLLITAFIYYNNKLSMQEQVENEYQRLEAEKALEEWQEQKLLAMARYDALTGAFSRRYALEQLEAYRRKEICCAIAYMDIDGMKQINDCQGHAAGDQYLKDFAAAFNELLPENAFFARMGGDEFLAVFAGCGGAEAAERMKGIEEALAENSFRFSFGIAEAASEGADMIKKADMLMYEAKKSKRGSA